jgi:PAS domain S-box-containing protein
MWPRTWLAVTIVAVVLVPIALWSWAAVETRKLALETAEADQSRVTQTLIEHTLKVLDAQTLILDVVSDQAGERDCKSMRSDAALQHALAVATRRSAPVEIVWVMDADGYLCASSDPAMIDARSRAFRDYFIKARALAPDHYYVDRATIGLFTGLPFFSVSKPRIKNGEFNGIILATVNGDGMTQAWDAMLGVTPTQRVGLFRQDGATIARTWDSPAPAPDEAAERRRAATWQSGPVGSGVRISLTDTRRVGAWRSLPDWGVVVTSSVEEDEVLRPWRRSTLIYGVLAVLTSGMSGALTWLLLRGQRTLSQTVDQRTLALRRSEDRLSLFIGGTLIGVVLLDTHMRYLAVSKRFLRDRGVLSGPEELLGRYHYEVFPETSEHFRDVYRRVLAGETVAAEEDSFRHPNGSVDWYRWDMAPWYEPDGTRGGAVLFYEVITARKEAEAVLSRSRDELEKLVMERSRELETTQARLAQAQRMEALGQLAGGIAHDINNVLQGVQSAASLIDRRPGDQDRVRRFVGSILEATGRGKAVTHRLLAFSRQSELQAEPIDAASLLAEMREILVHTIGAGITVRVESQADLSRLLADKGQLETVLVNLATNARDAMPSGGLLTLAAVQEFLDPENRPDHPLDLPPGGYIRLSISDTGTGMEPDVLARASEPFFTTKNVGHGTGLGLAMARGFATQSGGGLHIESTPGRGTTASLWFPVSPGALLPAIPPLGHQALVAVPEKARVRLLLVDDDVIVRVTMAEQMVEEGYAVLTAADGAEALLILDAGEAIDLMITDYSMPGIDGLALIKEAQQRRPTLAAILLTGFATDAAKIAITGATSGRFTLLLKPVTATALAERVKALLERAAGVPSVGCANGNHPEGEALG